MKGLLKFFWGLYARVINLLVPVKERRWVFGSDYGKMYREGSKYMIEHILKNHPEIKCTFITCSKEVLQELKSRNIPCLLNNSPKGIFAIAEADAVFTCQYTTDILYVYKKKKRKFYYMVHGQAYKKVYDLRKNPKAPSAIDKIKSWIQGKLVVGYDIHEVSFMPVTSDYEGELMSQWFSGKVPMYSLGMPRNDALFQNERMKNEKWIKEASGKKIITYMPTHRQYGQGELSPIPFLYDEEKQNWLREHNILFVVKQHPNMAHKLSNVIWTDVIVDITKERIDPMVAVYHSDVLITDFSSVWMDFILLKRPFLFYFYDDFEENDSDVFFNIKDIAPEHCCYDENALFNKIKEIEGKTHCFAPSDAFISKFHKYVDGNSCERYYQAVVADLYGM